MTKLMIDALTPGAILDEAVKNANGTVLIPAGAELSEKHIRALKMWGIVAVSVKSTADNADGDAAAVSPVSLEKAKAELEDVFALANIEHPVMAEIFKQSAIRHARNS